MAMQDSRSGRLIGMAIPAGSLLAVIAVFAGDIGTVPYPARGAALFAAAAALEGLVLWAVLRPRTYWHSWGRALCAAMSCLVALWFSAQDTAGAPEFVFMHQRWLVAAAFGCLLQAFASACRYRLRTIGCTWFSRDSAAQIPSPSSSPKSCRRRRRKPAANGSWSK